MQPVQDREELPARWATYERPRGTRRRHPGIFEGGSCSSGSAWLVNNLDAGAVAITILLLCESTVVPDAAVKHHLSDVPRITDPLNMAPTQTRA